MYYYISYWERGRGKKGEEENDISSNKSAINVITPSIPTLISRRTDQIQRIIRRERLLNTPL